MTAPALCEGCAADACPPDEDGFGGCASMWCECACNTITTGWPASSNDEAELDGLVDEHTCRWCLGQLEHGRTCSSCGRDAARVGLFPHEIRSRVAAGTTQPASAFDLKEVYR